MNLALRDVRRNKLRFVLTALGIGMLLGVVMAMTGIYEGALTERSSWRARAARTGSLMEL